MRKNLEATISVRCQTKMRDEVEKIADAEDQNTGETARMLLKLGIKCYNENHGIMESGTGQRHPAPKSDHA